MSHEPCPLCNGDEVVYMGASTSDCPRCATPQIRDPFVQASTLLRVLWEAKKLPGVTKVDDPKPMPGGGFRLMLHLNTGRRILMTSVMVQQAGDMDTMERLTILRSRLAPLADRYDNHDGDDAMHRYLSDAVTDIEHAIARLTTM